MKSNVEKVERTERDIFLRAVEIKSDQARAVFVREHCQQDRALEERVWALLSKVWTNQPKIQLPGGASSKNIAEDSEAERLPTELIEFAERHIGPYTVIKKIGEGGVSEVYLAEQASPVRRTVALKLIKPGMETGTIFSRFKSEQQALELLSHSGIAKLLDAGFSQLGRPYLVLEYIDGPSITEYCNSQDLPLSKRLQLFLRVCESVQHAHQQGILHRDLKPSNILICNTDDEPAPKIIDFGIAKLLHTRDPGAIGRTRIGQLIGTLEYMSPEQASLGRTQVDMRSDVYALACILYELLAGKAPHAKELEQCHSVEEALKVIQEVVPLRPSRLAVPGSQGGLANWDSDLDWIVMKGLEKSIESRYATVHELVADLRRYLRRDVVLARPQTLLYVAARFSHRYRAAMTMVALTMLSVCVGLGASIWGWRTAVLANQAVTVKAAEAIEQRKYADNLLSFFLDGVGKSKPLTVSNENNPDMTIEQLLTIYLDALKVRIEADPPAIAPALASELLTGIGEIAVARYEPEAAATAFEMLVDLIEKAEPHDAARIFEAKYWLADSYFIGGKDEKAKAVLVAMCPPVPVTSTECDAVTLLARIYLAADQVSNASQVHSSIPASVHTPKIDLIRGDILLRSGKSQEAFDLVSDVLRQVDGDPDMTARCTSFLGVCLFSLNRFDEGLEYFERLVAIEAGMYNKGHLASFDGRGQLMDAYIQCERYEQALHLAEQLKVDIEKEHATAPIRQFLPMLRLRITQCLVALRRSDDLLSRLANDPIPESQLRGRELFELNSYIAIAHALQGNREQAAGFIQQAKEVLATAGPDQFLFNLSKEKIDLLCKKLEISLD